MKEVGWLQPGAVRVSASHPTALPAGMGAGSPGRASTRAGDMGHGSSRAEAPALVRPDMLRTRQGVSQSCGVVGWVAAPCCGGPRGGQDGMEPASHPSPAELDMAQLAIMGLATIMTLLSVAIFVEEAFYLTRKIRCPIKMKTLCWSSSAPTVSWGVGWWGASLEGARATQAMPAPGGGGGSGSVPSLHISQVVSVVSCFGLWIPRSMMVVEMATTM